MKLVLASQSPRRRELLEWIQKDFIVQASSAEEVIPPGATPYEAVELLAKAERIGTTGCGQRRRR